MPLVRGRYPVTNPVWSAFGQPTQVLQSDLAARSNAFDMGYADQVDQGSALVTAKTTFVPVHVEVGDAFTYCDVYSGNTAASSPTHQQAYLISGVLTTGALIATSTDLTTTAVAAGALVRWTFTTNPIITSALAPYGYIYVGIGFTGTTAPSILGTGVSAYDIGFVASSTWLQKPKFAATQAVGASGTAPSTVTLASNAAQAACPWVFLS